MLENKNSRCGEGWLLQVILGSFVLAEKKKKSFDSVISWGKVFCHCWIFWQREPPQSRCASFRVVSLKLAQGRCHPLRCLCHCWHLGIASGGLGLGSPSIYRAKKQVQALKKHTENFSLLFGLLPTPLGAVTQEWKLPTDTAFLEPGRMEIHSMEQTWFCTFPVS